jgi:nucleoid DNA-binding protein
MNELVNLIVKKTGIPAATAQVVVNTIVDYLKAKLPAPVGAQIDGLLNNQGISKMTRTAKHRADDVID